MNSYTRTMLLAVLIVSTMSLGVNTAHAGIDGKLLVCHIVGGGQPPFTIEVANQSVFQAHILHGDTVGACEPEPPIECDEGFELVDGECVPIECEVGFELVGNDCVPIECDEGFELIGNDCVPIVCDEGFELVGNDCVPIECDEGFELIGNDCVPIECPIGSELVGNDCIPIECPEGFELIGNDCIPIECDEGFELVGNDCIPIECPTGTVLVGNECIPIECDEGTILVGNECIPIECDEGTVLVGNECIPIECPEGTTLIGNECVPIECPEGEILIGDTCVPIECLEGEILVGNECVPIECDEGTILVGDQCIPIECDEGTVLVGNECQPIECPEGTILVGNDCVAIECEQDCEPPIIECDEGFELVNDECVEIECEENCEEPKPKAEDNNDGGSGATPPTLGVNTNHNILQVEGGFSCNNQTVDVNYWFTAFPQISLEVGDKLSCDFKIFDEHNGWDNVEHFDFALGKYVGETMSTTYGKLSLDIDQVTREQTVTFDQNQFDNVLFVASDKPVLCLDGEEQLCLAIHLEFTTRVPFTDDKVVGTQVWNYQRSTWSNYFNEGIEVKGDTMNELPIYSLIGKYGQLHNIQLTDKTLQNTRLAVDLDSGIEGIIIKDVFVSTETVIVTPVSDSGTERHGSAFKLIKEWHTNQVLKLAMELYPNVYDEPYDKINDIFTHTYPKRN